MMLIGSKCLFPSEVTAGPARDTSDCTSAVRVLEVTSGKGGASFVVTPESSSFFALTIGTSPGNKCFAFSCVTAELIILEMNMSL